MEQITCSTTFHVTVLNTRFVVAQLLNHVSLQTHGLQHARLSRLHHLLELAQTHVY